jgi:alkylation response protein AidB-like acyl-CoA dehydrogenase
VNAATGLGDELRGLVRSDALELPDPGCGATPERLTRLLELARSDLSLARLAEAHVDAVAILHEAGRAAPRHAIYGVWAADDPSCQLGIKVGCDGWTLTGTKAFCSGATIVDRALLTVRRDDRVLLFDIDAADEHISYDATRWRNPAFADTTTAVATFDHLPIATSAAVADPDWYLERAGFWHGALAPAACWAGGAVGLVDAAWARTQPDVPISPLVEVHLGTLGGLEWELRAILRAAGDQIDTDPRDAVAARCRALAARHRVERAVGEVIDGFGRAFGPRPLIEDPAVIRRIGQLQVYVRQHHAEADLQLLARSLQSRARTT